MEKDIFKSTPPGILNLLEHDDILKDLFIRLGQLNVGPTNIDQLHTIDFWNSLDCKKLDVRCIDLLLSLHFTRKTAGKNKSLISSELQIEPMSSWIKYIGLPKSIKEVKKYVVYFTTTEIVNIMNACFCTDKWNMRHIKKLQTQLYDTVKNVKHRLSADTFSSADHFTNLDFTASDLFVATKYCPAFCLLNVSVDENLQTKSSSRKATVSVTVNSFANKLKSSMRKRAKLSHVAAEASSAYDSSSSTATGRRNMILLWKTTKTRMDNSIRALKARVKKLQAEKYKIFLDRDRKVDQLNEVIDNLKALLDQKDHELNLKLGEKTREIMTLEMELGKYRENLEHALDEIEDYKKKALKELEDEDFEDIDLGCVTDCDKMEFPQINMRESRNKINPKVIKGLAILRNYMDCSYKKIVPILVHIGNAVFDQKWVLGKSKYSSSRKRILLPTMVDEDNTGACKAKITKMTAPCPNFYKNIDKKFILPNAVKETFLELKSPNTVTATLQFDHMSYNRKKAMTKSITTATKNADTGETRVHYRNLGISDVCDLTADGSFKEISQTLRLGAVLTAKSVDANDIMDSIKDILKPLGFCVADGASTMAPVIDKINDWKLSLGLTGQMLYIHCNAHVIVALDSAIEIQLIFIEGFMKIQSFVVREFNASFFKKTNSVILTMIRAIFLNVGQSEKNEEWACKAEFQSYMAQMNNGELGNRNLFFNPKSSRFGKYSEMALILAFNFETMKTFFCEAYKANRMFASCTTYMSCPMFYEILLAMSVILYHIMGPFLAAVGAETQYGFRDLSHDQLLYFYPKLVAELESLTADPSPLLCSDRLQYLKDFQDISKISNKTYANMFDSLFYEISNNEDIDVKFIKTILPLFCEEFLIALKRQVTNFYLGQDSVVYKVHKSNPIELACVPTTSLSAEHSVGTTRQSIRKAPTANMSTHSNKQVIKSSPFMNKLMNMDDQTILLCQEETRKSKQVKLFLECNTVDKKKLENEQRRAYERLVAAKSKNLTDKRKLVDTVKNHGGPVTCPEDVDVLVQRHKHLSEKQLWDIIHLEIKYQKTVLNAHLVCENQLFLCSTKNKVTGKMDKFSVNVRIGNLKSIVIPVSEGDSFNSSIDIGDFESKVKLHHEKMMRYPHRSTISDNNDAAISTPCDAVVPHRFNTINVTDHIACFFSGYDQPWYIGIVTQKYNIADCDECHGNRDFNKGLGSHCFQVQFLSEHKDKKDKRDNLFVMKDRYSYHVSPCQIIDCMLELSIEPLKSKFKVRIHVLNAGKILECLNQNKLYAAI